MNKGSHPLNPLLSAFKTRGFGFDTEGKTRTDTNIKTGFGIPTVSLLTRAQFQMMFKSINTKL
ncbi:conserved hypothetical protein [Treponema phagedenis]|uniref:Uncharacterized protein n=1 Tax=Treponema phagedenis TaxID=162 RepID=A0A0B7GYG0_TREPH|nr:hypothetical protein HMPREF9554_01295 [Treponema phagedenis F0421]CEM62667.1 conserved hypothetical protein [Treponema phagedenis]